MRIFISYPREFQEFAEKIKAELRNRHFNAFLDKHKLKPSQAWTVEIERQIKRSNVYVILYDPAAAADRNRYFHVEIELIKKELEGNLSPIRRALFPKHVVPVIFDPTTNLPADLQYLHAVLVTKENYPDKEQVPQWIYKVSERVKELKKDEQKRSLTLTIAAILTLVSTVMIAPGFTNSLITDSLSVIKTTAGPVTVKMPKKASAESEDLCKSLEGEYQLAEEYKYVYMEQKGIRATSVDGSWENVTCKENVHKEQEGAYLLEGKDKTKHRIEIKINGKYEYVADGTNKSDSEITINRDGGLTNRRIFYRFDEKPETTKRNLSERFWKEHERLIDDKLKDYAALIEEKHRSAHGKPLCIPMHGKKDDIDVIASLCSGDRAYIRVMKKVKGR